ncbi:glycoside hydrolase [Rhizopogon salebrosus TDB-379]|nr:glycoside hydrolase [Rhizopogon salebrosus TDB-379]
MLLILVILPLFALLGVCAKIPAAGSTSPIAATWYAGWHATEGFPLSSVSWEKYDTIYYSFATPTSSVDSLSLDGSDGNLLPEFVSTAHANSVEAHISIGGWGGSLYFSSNLATAANRTAFVKTVVDFASKYDVDGVQFESNYFAPLIAGFIYEGQGWHWVMYWAAIINFRCLIVLFFFMEETNFVRNTSEATEAVQLSTKVCTEDYFKPGFFWGFDRRT